jgi:hypothetical protein
LYTDFNIHDTHQSIGLHGFVREFVHCGLCDRLRWQRLDRLCRLLSQGLRSRSVVLFPFGSLWCRACLVLWCSFNIYSELRTNGPSPELLSMAHIYYPHTRLNLHLERRNNIPAVQSPRMDETVGPYLKLRMCRSVWICSAECGGVLDRRCCFRHPETKIPTARQA